MLYAVEQEYIPMRSFMENFKSQYQKDISLDELITLFLNDKISFYLHVKGNQNKISISPNSSSCYFSRDSFDIEFCMYKKHVCTAVRFNSPLIPKEENNIIISNIKDKTFSYTNKHIGVNGNFEKAIYSKEYDPITEKTDKEIVLPLQNIFIDATLKIDTGLKEYLSKDGESRFLKDSFEKDKGYNFCFRFLRTDKYNDAHILISFDKFILKKENSNGKNHISYLDSILLSTQEMEKCFKELTILSALDKNEKESKEVEALKQEIQNLQNSTEKLREENQNLKRQLREIEKDSSKCVIAGLLDIIYTNKHKGHRNRNMILSTNRISINALANEIEERVDNLKTEQRFIGDSYGNTSIRKRLTPIAREMKIL